MDILTRRIRLLLVRGIGLGLIKGPELVFEFLSGFFEKKDKKNPYILNAG